MCRRRPFVHAPHRARCGAGLRSASRLRRPRHRGESGKFCASSSANLLAFVYGPPRDWIDGNPVLAELHVSTDWLPALATADCAPPPITATGSPVTTNTPQVA